MTFDPKVIAKLKLGLNADRSRLIIRSSSPRAANAIEYSFGIEEEYFLADRVSHHVASTTPDALFEAANWATGGHVMREMLQSQVEVATNIHTSPVDALEELRFLRSEVSAVANSFGFSILACGTHPTAAWTLSQLSEKKRYADMIGDLQNVGRRNMLCGMHVHVQLPDTESRLKVLNLLVPYLPLFTALSASSPFWNSRDTGLKGYRLAAYDELPRTGIPETFETCEEYASYVDALTRSGAMPDDSHIWWMARMSSKHPTLELRAPDCCTSIEDTVAIASLYRVLVRYLHRSGDTLPKTTRLDRALAIENKWRAQRHGVGCEIVTTAGPVRLRDYLDHILQTIAPDIDALESGQFIRQCIQICDTGSSADRQLRVYRESKGSHEERLEHVNRWLAQNTSAKRPDIPAATSTRERSRNDESYA